MARMRWLGAMLTLTAGHLALGAGVPELVAPSLGLQPPAPRPRGAAAAGEQPPPEQAPGEQPLDRQGPPPVSFEVRLGGTFAFSSDLDDGGDVSISRVRPGFGVNFVLEPRRTFLNFDLEFEYSRYDFSSDTRLVAAGREPWQDIYREGVSATLIHIGEGGWSYLLSARAGFSHEDGADVVDGFEVGGIVAVRYALSERLQIGVGVGVFSQIEDDPLIIPVPAVQWRITDELTLTNDNRPGLFLAYQPSQEWKFAVGGEYQSRDFRLAKSGPTPDGVGRDRRFPLSVGVTYTPNRQFVLEARGGVDVGVEYTVKDSSGDTLTEQEADATPFVGFGLTYRF